MSTESLTDKWTRRRKRLSLMIDVFGPWRGWTGFARESLVKRHAELTTAVIPEAGPVELRLRSRDVDTFKQVVVDDEYSFATRYKEPEYVIDAGANIGLATTLLATRYPRARILAIEPDPGNFELLKRNTSRFPTVTPICAALVAHAGETRLVDPGLGEWAFRVSDDTTAGVAVQGVDVPWLLREFDMPRIDLFKVDIEGAEKALFEASAPWIDKVNVIIAELHDRFATGCSRAFFAATSGFEIEEHRGENILVCRRSFLAGA